MKGILLSAIMTVMLFSGCMPRGESKTLDQVLDTARQRYHSATMEDLSSDVRESLDSLVGQMTGMEGVEGWEELRTFSEKTLEILPELEERAGMTAQAAFDEIEGQYRELSPGRGEFNKASVKLLLARTYNLLAGELESTRFKR